MKGKIYTQRAALVALFFFFTLTLSNVNQTMAQIPEWSWAKNPSGNNEDYALAVTADASGNSYAAGYFASTTLTFESTVLTKTGGADIFIVKYDGSGNVLWAKNAGGDGTEKAYAVAADGSGNVYVAGFFNSSSISFGATTLTNTGGDDVFIAKYDGSNGNVLWAKSATGSGNDQARSLTTDGSGNVYVAGYFYSASIIFSPNVLNNSNLNGSSADLYIVKYNSAGTVQWSRKAGGSVEDDFAYSVANASGNIYLAGPFASSSITFGSTILTNTSSSGSNDFYIVKYDGSGNVLWAKKAGGTGQDWLQSVTADNSGDAILTGYFLSSSITIGSTTLSNEGDADIFIAKYNGSTGNVVWATGAGGTSTDQAYSVTSDPSGNCYVAGYFSSASIIFGSTTLTNNSAGSYDIFLAKYDVSGNSVWAQQIGGNSHDQAYSVFNDASGNIYLAGGFGSSTLTFGSHTITNSAVGDFDVFVAQIGALSCTVPTGEFTSNITSISAKANWNAVGAANKYKVRYRETGTVTWTKVITINNYKKLKNLMPSTTYDWQVNSVCKDLGLGISNWSATQNFTTDQLKLGSEEQLAVELFPNPFSYSTTISFKCEENSRVQIALYDLTGRMINPILDENLEAGFHELNLNRDHLTSGIYFLQFRINKKLTIKKLVIE